MDRTDDPVALAADEPLRRIVSLWSLRLCDCCRPNALHLLLPQFRIVLTYQSSLLAVMVSGLRRYTSIGSAHSFGSLAV